MKAASIQKALGAFNMLVTLFIAAPLVFVVAVAFTPTERLALPPGGQLSLRWFEALIHNQGFVRTFIFSSCLAVSAASISTIIGVLGAFGIVRHKFKYRNLLETLFISPLTIPAAVLGVALLQFFLLLGWFDSLVSMLAAHVVVTIPYVIRLVGGSLQGVDEQYEMAAQNLGATWLQVLTRVTMPLIRSAILAGLLFAAIISFDNITVSLFIAGVKTETLPIRMLNHVQDMNDPLIAAVSTALILLAIVSVVVFERLFGLQKLFRPTK